MEGVVGLTKEKIAKGERIIVRTHSITYKAKDYCSIFSP